MEQFPAFKALLSMAETTEWTTWRLDSAPVSKTNSIPSQEGYRKPLGIWVWGLSIKSALL